MYHPPFQIDLEDAPDVSERFANHTHAVAQGVQHMRGMFTKSVRQARVEMANAERSLGYEILGLLNGRLGSGSGLNADEEEEEEEEEWEGSPSRSPNRRMRRREKQRKGIQNTEGAWCWREECSGKLSFVLIDDQTENFVDCLRLTKCMQKTAETLQGVADLYENHVSQCLCPLNKLSLPFIHLFTTLSGKKNDAWDGGLAERCRASRCDLRGK